MGLASSRRFKKRTDLVKTVLKSYLARKIVSTSKIVNGQSLQLAENKDKDWVKR